VATGAEPPISTAGLDGPIPNRTPKLRPYVGASEMLDASANVTAPSGEVLKAMSALRLTVLVPVAENCIVTKPGLVSVGAV